MIEKTYMGVNGVARRPNKIYVGDGNGVARKVVAAYVGVNGKARKIWPFNDISKSILPSGYQPVEYIKGFSKSISLKKYPNTYLKTGLGHWETQINEYFDEDNYLVQERTETWVDDPDERHSIVDTNTRIILEMTLTDNNISRNDANFDFLSFEVGISDYYIISYVKSTGESDLRVTYGPYGSGNNRREFDIYTASNKNDLVNLVKNTRLEIDFNRLNGSLYVNDSLKTTFTNTFREDKVGYPTLNLIFNNSKSIFDERFHRTKIYYSGKLIYDFIPCYTTSSPWTPGIYDLTESDPSKGFYSIPTAYKGPDI